MPDERGPDAFGEDYFARTYGGTAGSYEARTTPNKWRSMVAFIRRHAPSFNDALDVGCADGSFLAHATAAFPQARFSGTDVSEYALERARQRLPKVTFQHSTAERLPFESAAFDLVTAFDVLEHLPSLEAGVSELHRLARPGGVVIVTVPVYDGPLGWLVHLLDKDPTHLHKQARAWWLEGPLRNRFELLDWDGAWRYYFRRYWHFRGKPLRGAAPAIVTAWRKTR